MQGEQVVPITGSAVELSQCSTGPHNEKIISPEEPVQLAFLVIDETGHEDIIQRRLPHGVGVVPRSERKRLAGPFQDHEIAIVHAKDRLKESHIYLVTLLESREAHAASFVRH